MIKTIATTRFNDDTYKQNINYKRKMKHNGALYGSPVRIKDNIPLDTSIYVIEMNNSTNRIEGIGMIKNENILDKHYRIYNNIPSLIVELDQNSDDEEDETNMKRLTRIESGNCRDYNSYVYKGSKHISRCEIKDEYFIKVIEVLENCCFKGATHCKRSQGITQLSDWILENKHNVDFIKIFDKMFKTKYSKNKNNIKLLN